MHLSFSGLIYGNGMKPKLQQGINTYGQYIIEHILQVN